MKKKLLIALLALTAALSCVFGISACNFGSSNNDETGADGHTHEYGEWTVLKEASCTEEGSRERTCTICEYVQNEVIPKLDHRFGEDNKCSVCGYELVFTTGLAYEKYDSSYMVIGIGTATDKDLVIPAYHAGKAVRKIADSAFKGKDDLTSVYIANGIREIGASAFEYCTGIKKVSLPESLSDTVYVAYEKTYNIGSRAFYGCQKLAEITMPSSGTLIAGNIFTSTAYYNDAKHWKNGVLYIGNHLIATNEKFTSKSYTVSEDTVSIADGAFSGKSTLTEFIIPKNNAFIKMGENALSGTSVKKATVPTSCLNYLPKSNMTDLTLNTIPYNNDLNYSFCKLERLTIPQINEKSCLGALFGTQQFNGSVATEQITYVSSGYYPTTRTTTYYIPSSLKSVTVTSGVIPTGAFSGCSNLSEIILGNEVTLIEDFTFYSCTGLTSIAIPDSVTAIYKYSLDNCSGLKNITIGNGVKGIDSYVFYSSNGCNSLESITVSDGNEKLSSQDGILYDKDKTKIKYIPKAIKGNITIPDGITDINDRSFKSYSGLTGLGVTANNENYSSQDGILYTKNKTEIICIPESLKGSITLANGLTSIKELAFYENSGITSVKIPGSVDRINSAAFACCSALTNVTIENGVTRIGSEAFGACKVLKSINIPDSVTSIGYEAFTNCDNLTSVTLGSGLTSINSGLFIECLSLNNIIIPESITTINNAAFAGCISLTNITIPLSVVMIDTDAFAVCSKLTDINFKGTKEQWNAIEKEPDWDDRTGDYTVHCTDGDIKKS